MNRPRRDRRTRIAALAVEVVGIGAILFAAWQLAPWLALVLLGALLITVAQFPESLL